MPLLCVCVVCSLFVPCSPPRLCWCDRSCVCVSMFPVLLRVCVGVIGLVCVCDTGRQRLPEQWHTHGRHETTEPCGHANLKHSHWYVSVCVHVCVGVIGLACVCCVCMCLCVWAPHLCVRGVSLVSVRDPLLLCSLFSSTFVLV